MVHRQGLGTTVLKTLRVSHQHINGDDPVGIELVLTCQRRDLGVKFHETITCVCMVLVVIDSVLRIIEKGIENETAKMKNVFSF